MQFPVLSIDTLLVFSLLFFSVEASSVDVMMQMMMMFVFHFFYDAERNKPHDESTSSSWSFRMLSRASLFHKCARVCEVLRVNLSRLKMDKMEENAPLCVTK